MSAAAGDDSDWEIHASDGFVYMRRKRPKPPDPAPQPEEDKRKRRKAVLVSRRERLKAELERWEALSVSVETLGITGEGDQDPERVEEAAGEEDVRVSANFPVDELLVQVDVQKKLIQKLSSVCDIVESSVIACEEEMFRSLEDLPFWNIDPRALLSSLMK